MDWQIATQTHRGNVRKINEDSLLVEKLYPLLMVADGMGGHEAGDVASRMLAEHLGALELGDGLALRVAEVERCILQCNAQMLEYAERRLQGKTIGSTVVAFLADGTEGVCLWAGDSRLYRSRDGQLQQLSADHSYVAELVRSGQLLPEHAQDHPSSNVITRAVGSRSDLALDQRGFDVRYDDTFMLCTDGLYSEVTEAELLSAMLAEDIWQSSHQLLNLCLGREARDNVSFVLARPVPPDTQDTDVTLTFYPGPD